MLEKKFSVKSFDVYPNSTIKPAALQRYMQQIAREDCDNMGWTYINMREINMVFVMTKLGIKVNKPVFAYDELTVRTYNNKIKGIVFTREFEFYRFGEEVIHATTEWVIVNYDTRRIVRPSFFPYEIPEMNFDCATVEVPRAIESGETAPAGERIVRLSDLDENDHLNNCVYSDIAMDVLPYDRKGDYVKEARIIFRHEAKLGDCLNLSWGAKDGRLGVFAFNTQNNLPCFESDFLLEKING